LAPRYPRCLIIAGSIKDATPSGLPSWKPATREANVDDAVARATKWLRLWERQINEGDYQGARDLFSPNVLSFGTIAPEMKGLEQLESRQWRIVWPAIRDFSFGEPAILAPSAGSDVVVIASWNSLGRDGRQWYARRGRCTLVLREEAGGLRCIHSHFSMEPGIDPLRD